MSRDIYVCCSGDERRKSALRAATDGDNGIDFLEVVDRAEPNQNERQRLLRIFFLRPPSTTLKNAIGTDNVVIDGGERIQNIQLDKKPAFDGDVLEVHVGRRGDFSTYTLRLVEANGRTPLAELDPPLSSVAFSFKVECDGAFDCKTPRVCPTEERDEPEIDYLAKDYASFRQLMLDRLSVLMPQWRERNPADLGIALVEALAYVGDHLSYQQDAIATEAYLGTARKRASVRRHARLVDYHLHDGANARAWVHFEVSVPELPLARGAAILTRVPDLPRRIVPDSREHREALAARPQYFETLHDAVLSAEHNRILFHTWGERECCLPAGATRATLAGDLPRLRPGDVLVFEEEIGPRTGETEDADPTHRHAVRLTRVAPGEDRVFATPVTEIEWSPEDALPFPLCLSSITDEDRRYLPNVSAARGNIVLADHGQTVEETLPPVPAPMIATAVRGSGEDRCGGQTAIPVYPRFRPALTKGPLTRAASVCKTEPVNNRRRRLPFDPAAPASAAFLWEMRDVLPVITLDEESWLPRRDLLASDPFAPDFVVEVEEDGRAILRFGDGVNGQRPPTGARLVATYRIGNGTGGNVGAGALYHIVSGDDGIVSVRNPLPARGGTEPEPLEHARLSAPHAFRTQERAVTPEDYAAAAERHPQVQRAVATIRWTGSWYTVFLTVDRAGGLAVDAEFEADLREHMERFRMAGQDIEVDGPHFVALEIELFVCVQRGYFQSDVRTALLDVLSSRLLPDGSRGVFHPDNFTFGQPVYLSRLYAAAQAVAGVAFAEITTFRRLGGSGRGALDTGVLSIGTLEIARLDNDPNFPERGILRLTLEGGR